MAISYILALESTHYSLTDMKVDSRIRYAALQGIFNFLFILCPYASIHASCMPNMEWLGQKHAFNIFQILPNCDGYCQKPAR